jgi:Uncharacterized protein conserved in bacteria (DUF2252)
VETPPASIWDTRATAIAEYLGETDAFDRSITDFSERYADQNQRDYQEFVNAVKSGRLKASRASEDPARLAGGGRHPHARLLPSLPPTCGHFALRGGLGHDSSCAAPEYRLYRRGPERPRRSPAAGVPPRPAIHQVRPAAIVIDQGAVGSVVERRCGAAPDPGGTRESTGPGGLMCRSSRSPCGRRLPASAASREPFDLRDRWLRLGAEGARVLPRPGQPGQRRAAVLCSQPAMIVGSQRAGGHTGAFGLISGEPGGNPHLGCFQACPPLQKFRGPCATGEGRNPAGEAR